MEQAVLVGALALAVATAGCATALRSRGGAERLLRENETLEQRVRERTRALDQALELSRAQALRLSEANQSKSDFLNGLGHELRTPLNAVIGFAELIRMNGAAEPLTRRQDQAVHQILGAGAELRDLVDQVTAFARLQAGRVSLSIERVDPQVLLRQVCDGLASLAQARGVTLGLPTPEAGICVAADRGRLHETLTTLISHAIRRSSSDAVVSIALEADDDAELVVRVSDAAGSPTSAELGTLFKPFETFSDPALPRGEAMNLTLARGLVEAMGGRLTATAGADGLDLVMTLARAARRDMPVVAAPDRPLPQATLLYVEDNPSNIALMRQVITALGPLALHVAETGPEGLTLARDLRPDVVILDINLPGMDGIEVKARLDGDPLTRDIPVIALSAGALPDDLAKVGASGFSTYLAKPLHVPALAQALERALAKAAEDPMGEQMRATASACA